MVQLSQCDARSKAPLLVNLGMGTLAARGIPECPLLFPLITHPEGKLPWRDSSSPLDTKAR